MRLIYSAAVVFAIFAYPSISQAVSIVTIGDSIVQTYPDWLGIWGWGQTLPGMFSTGPTWTNLALSGESTKSFIDEGRWADAVSRHATWMLIEFGHNDSHTEWPTHYTDPSTTFRDNLRMFADQARAVGTEPIFVTPAARRGGPANDATLPLYTTAMLAVGQEKGVGVVDLHASTLALYEQLGASGQAILGPGGAEDVTHFGHYGAEEAAFLISTAIPPAAPGLTSYVVPQHIAAGRQFYAINPAVQQFVVDGTLQVNGLTLSAGQTFTLTGTGTTILFGTQSYDSGAVLQFGSATGSGAESSGVAGVPEPATLIMLAIAALCLLAYAWQRWYLADRLTRRLSHRKPQRIKTPPK